MSLLDTLLLKRDINVIIHLLENFFVSMDVTFREEEVYFSPSSSLQGENGHME